MITRNALRKLPHETRKEISGIIMFGDAFRFCRRVVPLDVDNITLNKRLPFDWAFIGILTIVHLLYPVFTHGEAVRFIEQHSKNQNSG